MPDLVKLILVLLFFKVCSDSQQWNWMKHLHKCFPNPHYVIPSLLLLALTAEPCKIFHMS